MAKKKSMKFTVKKSVDIAEEPLFEKEEENSPIIDGHSVDLRNDPIEKVWEYYPKLDHLTGKMREQLEERRRLRAIRYKLFRFQTSLGKNEPLESVEDIPRGFIDFWLSQKPEYAIDPRGIKINVPADKMNMVSELGGYSSFAKIWDVDADLRVYLRHSSVWQEWNATLHRIVPVVGE